MGDAQKSYLNEKKDKIIIENPTKPHQEILQKENNKGYNKDDVVVVSHISKTYGNFKALDNISFNVKKNIIFGLLGSNGAGKSTMLHILTGLLSYDKGYIYIFNKIVKKYTKELKKKVAIVPQKISLYDDLSIFDNLYIFARTYGLKRKEILDRIKELKKRLELGNLKRKVKMLSGGYQRRVSLAVSLIGSPEILVLDEALVGIDLETKDIIMNLLTELKKEMTIIITTHSIREAERIFDEICILHRGKKVLEGNTKKIVQDFIKEYGRIVNVKFKSEEIAKQYLSFFEKYVNKKEIVKLQDDTISIRLPINYNTDNFVNWVKQSFSKTDYLNIVNVVNPGLEEVMIKYIKD